MKKITTLFTALLFVSAVFMSNQLHAQASCVWAKKAGSTSEDFGVSVATDAAGNVYYLGNFYSATCTFGSTVLHNQPSAAFNYGAEMFLVKYDSCGTLKWAKQAGGNDETFGRALTVDATGNVYVTGYFSADTAYFGAVKLPRVAYTDAFLVKYNTNGIAQWAKCGSGNDQDFSYAVALDAANNIFVTGSFTSTSLTFGGNSIINGTNDSYTQDVFIAKFDNNGNNLWVTGNTSHASTSDHAKAFGIGTDAAGNAYVAGNFASSYIRFGTDSLALNGTSNRDIFVVKYDANGAEQWLRTAGGTSNDGAYALASDASGNVYITGYVGGQGTASFGTNTVNANATNRNAFLAKYDANGTALWARVPRGDFWSDNMGNSISLDAAGDPYIVGDYSSDSLNVGPVTLFNTSLLNGSGGGDYFYDVFIAKYKANGNVSWARTAGGDSTDIGNGIATGPHGAVYITGEYLSLSFIVAGITLSSGATAVGDAFIANNINVTTLTPDICVVSTDTTSTNNIVYWDKTMFTTVASFVVYREVTTSVYKPIGIVPFDSLSQFIDANRAVGPANGDPNVGTYRYKLQTVDTSGCYSPMSAYHNTVYFVSNNNGTFSWNTYDVENQITPVTQFDLLRDDNNTGVWNIVGTVAGTQTVITDPSWATFQTTANWAVDGEGFNCVPTRAAINTSRSNIKGARMSAIKNALQDIKTSVYPNPFSNNFTLELGAEANVNYTLEVTNTLGQVIRSMKITSARTIVSTEDWAAGVYFYKLYSATSLKAGKINKD